MSAGEFSIDRAIANLLGDVGLQPADSGGSIVIAGSDPIIPSRHRLGAMSAIAVMSNAVAIATIWQLRGGGPQDLATDLATSVHAINPSFAFQPTLNGYPYPRDRDSVYPMGHTLLETRDGRWCILTAHYRHMLFSWLKLLRCAPDPDSVRDAVAKWDARDLEDAAGEHGLAYATCMAESEWSAREQGALLAKSPVVEIRKIGASEPEPFTVGERPLSGVRVLSCTHAISGPVVGRTLAEHGADVLDLTSPNQTELDVVHDDANVGMRSALVDLKSADGLAIASALATRADVFVENQRSGAVERLGLGPEQLAALRPGIVVVSIRCYGDRGPWAGRGGHDMQGTAASGFAVSEGTLERPKLPITTMLNDYMTGYLGALGASAALLRRAREGGSYHVSVNLTRTAMWAESLGLIEKDEPAANWRESLASPPTLERETPLGTLHRLAPAVRFSATPPRWSDPILVPRGSSAPSWMSST